MKRESQSRCSPIAAAERAELVSLLHVANRKLQAAANGFEPKNKKEEIIVAVI